ncbi:hypothetical protein EJB05_35127, partial [Eragrostis curvula]
MASFRALLTSCFFGLAPAPAPALENDHILREILTRLPPLRSTLLRAFLVCKRWCRLLSDPVFLRCYRTYHRTPPLLGYFSNGVGGPDFTPTLSPPDRIPCERLSLLQDPDDPARLFFICFRHGLALLINRRQLEAVVWDPITGCQHTVPYAPEFRIGGGASCIHGAVMSSGADGDGRDGCLSPFKVVLIRTERSNNGDRTRVFMAVYESVTGKWSHTSSIVIPFSYWITLPNALVRNALCGFFHWRDGILEFDLDTNSVRVIQKPKTILYNDDSTFRVVRAQDQGLGLAVLSSMTIQLWARKAGSSDATMGWVLENTVELDRLDYPLFPADEETNYTIIFPKVVGFDEDNNAIHVAANCVVFTIQLDSLQCTKLFDCDYRMDSYYPYASFYTLGWWSRLERHGAAWLGGDGSGDVRRLRERIRAASVRTVPPSTVGCPSSLSVSSSKIRRWGDASSAGWGADGRRPVMNSKFLVLVGFHRYVCGIGFRKPLDKMLQLRQGPDGSSRWQRHEWLQLQELLFADERDHGGCWCLLIVSNQKPLDKMLQLRQGPDGSSRWQRHEWLQLQELLFADERDHCGCWCLLIVSNQSLTLGKDIVSDPWCGALNVSASILLIVESRWIDDMLLMSAPKGLLTRKQEELSFMSELLSPKFLKPISILHLHLVGEKKPRAGRRLLLRVRGGAEEGEGQRSGLLAVEGHVGAAHGELLLHRRGTPRPPLPLTRPASRSSPASWSRPPRSRARPSPSTRCGGARRRQGSAVDEPPPGRCPLAVEMPARHGGAVAPWSLVGCSASSACLSGSIGSEEGVRRGGRGRGLNLKRK